MGRYTFDDLPKGGQELYEQLKIIHTMEKLADHGSYNIYKYDNCWVFSFFSQNMGQFPICIPCSIGANTPAYVDIDSNFLKSTVGNSEEFKAELNDIGIMIASIGGYKNLGYNSLTTIGEIRKPKRYRCMFVKQESFYDFYMLLKKYKLF